MLNRQQIFEKIKKLLALSHSSNSSEAAIALSRAQKLMKEHSITLDDINLNSITELELDAPSALRAKHLIGLLGSIISSAFGLDYFFHTVNGKINSIIFIGAKDRIEAAGYAFTLLSRQICVIKKEFAKQERIRLSALTRQKIALFSEQRILEYSQSFKMPPAPFLRTSKKRSSSKKIKKFVKIPKLTFTVI